VANVAEKKPWQTSIYCRQNVPGRDSNGAASECKPAARRVGHSECVCVRLSNSHFSIAAVNIFNIGYYTSVHHNDNRSDVHYLGTYDSSQNHRL
jgi:hypothetical protein